MRTLHIQLLGSFRIAYDEELVVSIDTSRLQSVLFYLLLHRQTPQSRNRIAFTLWPDSSDSQARTNLRKYLHHLRRALPDAERFLKINSNTVQWHIDAPFTLDVTEFECAIETARQAEEVGDPRALQSELEKAIELYQGDLLPDCYEAWVLPQRERLSRMHISALDQLSQLLEEQRAYVSAIHYVQRLLRHDPLREVAHRRLIRLHALNNDRAKALQAYHQCATLLERELDVAPSQATQSAFERLLGVEHATASAANRSGPVAATVPLVGRHKAWTQLQTAWRTAIHQEPHFALTTGEAGIGKTRLAEELLIWAKRQGIATAATRSYAIEGPLAYAPVISWLRTETLRRAVLHVDDVWLTELARLLPELMTERPDLPRPEPLTESWQRQRLFEAITHTVLAADQPLMLFIDDLQWADEQTLALLHYLVRFDPQAKLLLIGTVRPEEVTASHSLLALLSELRGSEQMTDINLGRLNEEETAALARHVTARELDATERAYLYRETEGNPLFVVETLRIKQSDTQFRASGLRPLGSDQEVAVNVVQVAIPSTIHAVIEQRLSFLSAEARALTEVAAVTGRQFTFRVVAQASNQDEDTVVTALDELWQRRIIREREGDVYDFSHDKIREVAYSQLSRARRRFLHGRVAGALEAVSDHGVVDLAADLARHYSEAGETEKAVEYRLAAGKQALELSAYWEAEQHLRQGLGLLRALPANVQHDKTELVYQMALGAALVPRHGYTVPEVRDLYNCATDLAYKLNDEPRLVPVLYGLGQYYIQRCEWRTTRALGEQCLYLAQQTEKPNDLLLAHGLLGLGLSYTLQPARALQHLRQSLAYYDPQLASSSTSTDLGVLASCYAAIMLWLLGYPEQSLQEMDRALDRAHELSHHHTLAAALHKAGVLRMLRGEPNLTQSYAEQAFALSVKYEFPFWQAFSRMLLGWALSQRGQPIEGLTEIQHGLTTFAGIDANAVPYTHTLLAQIRANAGKIADGLCAADEALEAAMDSRMRVFESFTLRLKGDLLWQAAAPRDAVEAAYQQAIAVAQEQEARSFELQATMQLCRLRQQQGRLAETRRALMELYNWFTEGFDTPDLKAARALLEELS
jgi:DNA-binding SARP family transcriptional activator